MKRRYELTLNLKHPFADHRRKEAVSAAEIAEALSEAAGRRESTVVARMTDRYTGAVSMIFYAQFEGTVEVEPRVHPDMKITMGLNILPMELRQLGVAATEILGDGDDERTWSPHTEPEAVAGAQDRLWQQFQIQYKPPLKAMQAILDRRNRAANLLAERLARQLARRLPAARGFCSPIGEEIVDEHECRLAALLHLCRDPKELAEEMMRHVPEFGGGLAK